jgi:hypothetical protein
MRAAHCGSDIAIAFFPCRAPNQLTLHDSPALVTNGSIVQAALTLLRAHARALFAFGVVLLYPDLTLAALVITAYCVALGLRLRRIGVLRKRVSSAKT